MGEAVTPVPDGAFVDADPGGYLSNGPADPQEEAQKHDLPGLQGGCGENCAGFPVVPAPAALAADAL